MSYDKTKRATRRMINRATIARQIRIYRYDKTNTSAIKRPGLFRKQHANNCGRAHCMLCCNPRRTFGRVTLKELIANMAYKYELLEVSMETPLIINGRSVAFNSPDDNISYDQVVTAAEVKHGFPYAVVYYGDRKGNLLPDQSVQVSPYMIFNVVFMGNFKNTGR